MGRRLKVCMALATTLACWSAHASPAPPVPTTRNLLFDSCKAAARMMQDEAGDLCMGMVNTAARLAPLLPDDLRSCPLGEATALRLFALSLGSGRAYRDVSVFSPALSLSHT